MKKIKFTFWAIMSCMLSISLAGCNNEFDTAGAEQAELPKPETRNISSFRVSTLPVGYKLYRANQTASINWSTIRNEPIKNDDWGNALYFFDQDIRNYLDSDHPYFIESTLNVPIRVIDTDYEGFMDGSYDDKYVVAQVEAVIGSSKPAGTPFLLWLGEKGYGFRYYENMDRKIAVAIPHALLADNLCSQRVIATY